MAFYGINNCTYWVGYLCRDLGLGQGGIWLGQGSIRLGQDSIWLGQGSIRLGQYSIK